MSYKSNHQQHRFSLGDSQNALTRLVVINLTVFITLALCRAYFFFIYQDIIALEAAFRSSVLKWFALSPDPLKLIYRPWSFFIFPFANLGFWMVLGNMLWLWAFGFIFQDLSGNRKLIPLYLYGGWAGGIVYLILAAWLKVPADAIGYYGAAPSVMAVAIATTMLSPQYRIMPDLMGGFPLWMLTAFYVLISMITKAPNDLLSYMPIIAGGAMGYLFMQLIWKGYDISSWMSNLFEWAGNLFNPDKRR